MVRGGFLPAPSAASVIFLYRSYNLDQPSLPFSPVVLLFLFPFLLEIFSAFFPLLVQSPSRRTPLSSILLQPGMGKQPI